MVDLPRHKVGIVACSGEELPEGTITRLAALRVLEQVRPNDTVTICLPLFLAGGEGDRAFARFYPTIAIDGCELRCAERATKKYSNKPAISINVRDVIDQNELARPEGRRKLNESGLIAVEKVSEKITYYVDELLAKAWNRQTGEPIELEIREVSQALPAQEEPVSMCACGSGIPVQKVIIGGKEIALAGLPLIFQQFVEAGKGPNEANLAELMETIKIYNPIPADEGPAYYEGLKKAYTAYWFKEKNQMSQQFTYHTTVHWKGEHLGQIRMGNGPEMEFSAPPDSRGLNGVLTPEDAFVAAVNSCIMLMFIWSCERLKIQLLSYECRAEGTKVIELDRTEKFTQVKLYPQIEVYTGGEQQANIERRIHRALISAQKYSLVANSIKSAVMIEPTITIQNITEGFTQETK